MSIKILALTAAFAFAAPALVQEALAQDKTMHMNQDMPMHDMQMDMSKPMGDQGPSSQAFAEANAKMHKDMAIEMTGDADADFVRSMIPHHQGAIDMAKIELQYGKDPNIRKLAEAVIKAQEAEIADMNAWLKAHGK
ncbi:DUF305 domain-containing protein [Rhizobium sp. SEMIA 4085]|uniref:Ferritin-related protein n=1 Tax=Rhizobium gallicum bv. gallicum R602sp TaxID=1041138 RepID=A0A0B4X0C5_9HYPH|nr:DUF305 domain-containing protein [Rhizobium gallicum]AJD40235.1 ferritin-related protein [Rhizobium gallicum bv. gallicum R602sp]NNH28711.1 DUF305 domain-containing protein [Rhizobium sp. SEMIA 4085]TDW36705.1 DUF305 family protein family protein [Rhizobium azibense]